MFIENCAAFVDDIYNRDSGPIESCLKLATNVMRTNINKAKAKRYQIIYDAPFLLCIAESIDSTFQFASNLANN